MSGILRRAGLIWFIFFTFIVFIDSAEDSPPGIPPPGNPPSGNPPPEKPPGNGNPPPTNAPGLLTNIDPLCFTNSCLTDRGQSNFPVANNCTFYFRCAGRSDPKLESCNPGELFNKNTSQCERSTNMSICLLCPSSSSTKSESKTSSTTTSTTTKTSTTTSSTTKTSSAPGSTTSSSTVSGSSTISSTTPGSTTISSTNPGSILPSSTTLKSTISSSTTPELSTSSSTTPGSNTRSLINPGSATSSSTTPESTTPSSETQLSTASRSSTTTGEDVSSSTTSSTAYDINPEAGISTTATSTRLPTPVHTTKQSVATSLNNATSIDSSDGADLINTTSTTDATTVSGSAGSTTDADSVNSEDAPTTDSSTRVIAISNSSVASTYSTSVSHGATTESEPVLDSSTSNAPAVVTSNNTVPTGNTTTSTTIASSTSSTSSTESASSTDSTKGTVSTLSSASSKITLVSNSSAASLAAPSSSSSTLGTPDVMTSSSSTPSSSIMTSSSTVVVDLSIVVTQESNTTLPMSPATSKHFRREILFTSAPPEIVSEGTDLEFVCAFIWETTDFGPATIDKFIWILNGKEVESTGRIVIHTTPSSDNFSTSSISFKPTRSQDSGNLTCGAITSGFINTTSKLYEVLPKPRVTITPLVTTVRDGEDALLTCTAYATSNSNRTNGNVHRLKWLWLTNGSVLSVEEYPTFLTNSSTQLIVSTLNLTSPESDVIVTCLVETSLVNVSSANVTVRLLERGLGDPCPPETAAGIDWGMTGPASQDIQYCPNGTSGRATRDCVDSKWKPPDLDKCIANKFIDLQNEVNRVRDRNDILDNLTMPRLAEEIEETINNAINMTSAELEMSVDIISTMCEIYNYSDSSDVTLGQAELKAIMQAIDHLLNVSSWARAPQNLAISLLTTINLYSDIYANQSTKEAVFIVSQNLVYQVDGMESASTMDLHVTEEEELRFPDWTKVDWMTKDASFWTESSEDIISMKRQSLTDLKLHQNSDFNPALPVDFSSSCIRNLGKYLPLTEDQKLKGCYINSNVISLTFPRLNVSSSPVQPFIISAQHLMVNTNESMTGVCVFWNFSANNNGSWSESDCTTLSSNDTHTSCSCTHLTNFAILFSPYNPSDPALSIISTVGCIISVIALFLTIVLYSTQWKKMKSKRSAVLINLCIALIVANIIFLAGSDKTQSEAGCTAVAALLHYFFLAAFFLMLLEGVMLLIYVIFVFYVIRKALTVTMIIAAWVIPAVIVGISLGVTKTKGYGTKTTCWLSVENNVLWAFVAPALFIIFVNLIIIVIVLARIARAKVRSDLKKKRNKLLSMLRNIVILSPIMGVTWIFGVLSVNEQTKFFQYLFAITNSLQGLFIFILHGLCHTKNMKSSSSLKPKNRRLTGVLSRNSAPNIFQTPLSGTESQEDLVQMSKRERELYAEEIMSKQNSVQKVRFGQQLSNTSHTSNGTALTMLSNTSSSTNGRTSGTSVSDGRK